jgi:hypothetical protein
MRAPRLFSTDFKTVFKRKDKTATRRRRASDVFKRQQCEMASLKDSIKEEDAFAKQ